MSRPCVPWELQPFPCPLKVKCLCLFTTALSHPVPSGLVSELKGFLKLSLLL